MASGNCESGLQLLARLGSRPNFEKLETSVFPAGLTGRDVVEVYGEEGCGKTQLLLHLLATCILPSHLGGLDCSVIFIDTEMQLSLIRLIGMLEGRLRTVSNAESIIMLSIKKLVILQCHSNTQLLLTLQSIESLIANQSGIGLVMIDSLSSFYWIDRCGLPFSQQTNQKHLATVIHKLLTSYNIVMIATKLAMFKKKPRGSPRTPHMGPEDDKMSDHSEYLVKEWQKLVTHRLIMQCSRTTDIHQNINYKFSLTSHILKNQQKSNLDFKIEKEGLIFQSKSS